MDNEIAVDKTEAESAETQRIDGIYSTDEEDNDASDMSMKESRRYSALSLAIKAFAEAEGYNAAKIVAAAVVFETYLKGGE